MAGVDNPINISDTEDSDKKVKSRSADQVDFNVKDLMKTINPNSYATRKSFAQGLLDVGLIAANAAQLKYILTVGEAHPFYSLLLGLVITSLCLQVVQVVLCGILALIFNINNVDEQSQADIINNVSISIIAIVVVINIVISAFDIKSISMF